MKVTSVELWCSDVEASKRFYGEVLGMRLEFSDPHPPDDVEHYETMFGSVEDGSAMFFLLFPSEGRPPSSGVNLGVRVEDLDAVHGRARSAGVDIVEDLGNSPFGGRTARYRDPDGNLVTVTGR